MNKTYKNSLLKKEFPFNRFEIRTVKISQFSTATLTIRGVFNLFYGLKI